MANQYFLSDHCIIKFKTGIPTSSTEGITITHRNLDRIDLNKLKIHLYLAAVFNTIRNFDSLQELNNGYKQATESTLEIHAPEVNKITKKRNKSLI